MVPGEFRGAWRRGAHACTCASILGVKTDDGEGSEAGPAHTPLTPAFVPSRALAAEYLEEGAKSAPGLTPHVPFLEAWEKIPRALGADTRPAWQIAMHVCAPSAPVAGPWAFQRRARAKRRSALLRIHHPRCVSPILTG